MDVTKLPLLLDDNFRPSVQLNPVSVSIDMSLSPLSTAEMVLYGHDTVTVGRFVELFTPNGSAGIFRISIADETLGDTTRVSLEHGLCTLSDNIITGKGEKQGNARELLTKVITSQTKSVWKLGTVDVPDSELLTWSWEYSNALESLTNILDELPDYALDYDQTTTPWTLNIKKVSDADACECRLNRNMESVSISTDRTDLCTRLYIAGIDNPIDADTISKWGIVSRYMDADPDIGQDMLKRAGNVYLEAHKNPQLTVTIDALDLSKATGQDFDHFRLGSICRVCLPDYDQTIRQRIVKIDYHDVYGGEGRVEITLSSVSESIVTAMAGLIVDTTVIRKKVTQNTGDLRSQYDLILAAENSIKLYAEEIDVLSKRIDVQAEEIAVKADKILLDAYVKITELEAEILNVLQYASVPNLIAGNVIATEGSFSSVGANNATINGTLKVVGNSANWQNTEVITGVGGRGVTGEYKTIQYLNWDGAKASTSVMTGFTQGAFSTTTKTLNYLGEPPTE